MEIPILEISTNYITGVDLGLIQYDVGNIINAAATIIFRTRK
jgi:hypothetical protein